MRNRIATLIIILCALALLCAPIAHGDGALDPHGITPTPAPTPGAEPTELPYTVQLPVVFR